MKITRCLFLNRIFIILVRKALKLLYGLKIMSSSRSIKRYQTSFANIIG